VQCEKGGDKLSLKIGYKKGFAVTFAALLVLVSLNLYSTVRGVSGPFTIPKPYTADLVPEVVFTVDSITFHYVVATQQYDTCSVVVRNIHASASYAGTVTVTFEDVNDVAVASGSATFTAVSAGATTTVPITLTWTAGKTVAHVDAGVVQATAA